MTQRTKHNPVTGCFEKFYMVPWDESHWNDGWVMNKGRFMVYRPDFPKAYQGKFALRHLVVWWLRTGEVVPKGYVIHHINGNKLDDRFENLQKMELGEHTRHHCSQLPKRYTCEYCGDVFSPSKHRGQRRLRFCSQICYHKAPRSLEHKQHQAIGLKLAYAEGRR